MITRRIVVFIKLVILIVPSLQTNSNDTNQITNKQSSIESTTERLHLKKCCPFGQSYYLSIHKCQNTTEEFSPDVWRDGKLDERANSLNIFHFDIGQPDCLDIEELVTLSFKNYNKGYYLDADGNINPNESEILKPGEYCLDKFTDDDDGTSFVYNAVVCYLPPKKQSYVLVSTCMLISCVFIIATVAVYAILPKLRSSMLGIILITYLIVQLFAFLTLSLMQILNEMYEISVNFRVIWSFTIYFFLLCSYFWLNVLCFDTWKTLRSTSRRSGKREMMKKFYKYAVYAFGVPALLTIILITLELSNSGNSYPYLPLIRERGARFLVGLSRFLYLYVPLLILCVANLTFFLWTIWNLIEHKRKTKAVLNSEDSARTDQRSVDLKSFVLSLKLFAIMGITWFLEVISSFYPDIQDTVWKYFDGYNVLSGLVIFIIFVCKKSIYIQLIDRYKELRGIPKSESVATMRTLASTNDNLNA